MLNERPCAAMHVEKTLYHIRFCKQARTEGLAWTLAPHRSNEITGTCEVPGTHLRKCGSFDFSEGAIKTAVVSTISEGLGVSCDAGDRLKTIRFVGFTYVGVWWSLRVFR